MKKFLLLAPAIAAQSALAYLLVARNDWVLGLFQGDPAVIGVAAVITTAACCIGFNRLFKDAESHTVFTVLWMLTAGFAALVTAAGLIGESISLPVGALGIWLGVVALITLVGTIYESMPDSSASARV